MEPELLSEDYTNYSYNKDYSVVNYNFMKLRTSSVSRNE